MKVEDIEAFVAVIRSESLSRAAQELGLTQPILTRRIQGFESELGIALFDRQTKPLRPTTLGQRLYDPCRSVLQAVETVRDLAASDLPPTGGLRLGLTQGLGELTLLPLLAQLRGLWPELEPQVSTGWSAQLAERIGLGELDAAAVFRLSEPEARDVIDAQLESIRAHWPKVCDEARLGEAERNALWGRQFLNPFALQG